MNLGAHGQGERFIAVGVLLGHLVELRRIFSHAASNRVVPEGPDQLPGRLRFQITPPDKKVHGYNGKRPANDEPLWHGPASSRLIVAGEPEQLQHRQEEVQHVQVHADRGHHIVVLFAPHQAAGVVQNEA